ncbi:MAG TPA: rhomboid family intramembrane serine protease [Actinomycetota bacterium]|nr:rhomboid family intramembrane serine protease [Actinomycetota bacterium]
MSTTPEPPAPTSVEPEEMTYCYAHKDTPTRLRCTRCDRLICGRCAIPASVGQHCPECVAEAQKSAPKVRSAIRATAPVVFTILVINVVVWLTQSFVYRDLTFRFGAIPIQIAAGEWYRLLTPMFLHAPVAIWHIGFNSYALFLFGPNVEQAFGHVKFLILYLIAGFSGSAMSYAFGSCASVGVGASGAIFGVLGALLVFLYNRRRSTFVRAYMKNVVFLIVINLVIGQIMPNIDNLAHLGGLIGGLGVGAAFDNPPGRKFPAGVQALLAAAVLLAAVGLVMWRTSNFVCG